MISFKREMGFWIHIYFELDSLNKEFFQMDHLGGIRAFGEYLDFALSIDDHNTFLLVYLVVWIF